MKLGKLLRSISILPAVLWHQHNIKLWRQGLEEEEERIRDAPRRLKVWREQLAEEQAKLELLQRGADNRIRYDRDRGASINVSAKVHHALRATLDQQGASWDGKRLR